MRKRSSCNKKKESAIDYKKSMRIKKIVILKNNPFPQK